MQYANYQPYPYYQNHMQSPQEIKKAHDLKTLQKNQADWAFIFLLIFINEYHCSRYNIFINRVYDAEYGYF